MAISTTPMATSSALFEMKYGYTISANPHTSGTGRVCLRPYKKKPAPMALNTRPSRSDEVSTSVVHCDERLQLGRDRAGLFPAHATQVMQVMRTPPLP